MASHRTHATSRSSGSAHARGGGHRTRSSATPSTSSTSRRRTARCARSRSRPCAPRSRRRPRSAPRESSSTSARTSAHGIAKGLRRAVPPLRELLELTDDRLWLILENSAGAGGTMGRSVDELAAIFDAPRPSPAARDLPRLVPLVGLGRRRHRPRSRSTPRSTELDDADRPRPAPLPPRQRRGRRARLEPRPPCDDAARARSATGSRRSSPTPRSRSSRRSSRRPGPTGYAGELKLLRELHKRSRGAAEALAVEAFRLPEMPAPTQSATAKTRKLGLASGSSKNSGLRQPTSSTRCS